jgi:hypothetical protein
MSNRSPENQDPNDIDLWDRVPTNKLLLPSEVKTEIVLPEDIEYWMPEPQPTFLEKLWSKSKRDPFVPIGQPQREQQRNALPESLDWRMAMNMQLLTRIYRSSHRSSSSCVKVSLLRWRVSRWA